MNSSPSSALLLSPPTPPPSPSPPEDSGKIVVNNPCRSKRGYLCPDNSCRSDPLLCKGTPALSGKVQSFSFVVGEDSKDKPIVLSVLLEGWNFSFFLPSLSTPNIVCKLSIQDNDGTAATFEFPPNELKVGWNVSVSDPSRDVLQDDRLDGGDEDGQNRKLVRFLSVPVQMNVFDEKGRPVRRFNKTFEISLFASSEYHSNNDDDRCVAFNSDEYNENERGWECFANSSFRSTRTRGVTYATTSSDHLTSFAVLLGSPVGFSDDNQLDWISIASLAMIGSTLVALVLVVCAYYLSEQFRAVVGGWESHRSLRAIESRLESSQINKSIE